MKKIANVVGAGVLVAAAAVWASPKTPAPKEELQQIRAKPERMGKSLDRGVLIRPGAEKWVKGPASLPAGVQMAKVEGDPATADRLFTLRLKLPDGARIAPHFHSTDEHITVVSGDFRLGMGERFDEAALQSYPAGSFLAMPAGHLHFADARGETVVQLHGAGPWTITYLDPADDPRLGTGGAGKQGGR